MGGGSKIISEPFYPEAEEGGERVHMKKKRSALSGYCSVMGGVGGVSGVCVRCGEGGEGGGVWGVGGCVMGVGCEMGWWGSGGVCRLLGGKLYVDRRGTVMRGGLGFYEGGGV